jgi:uncharacterized protein YgiM (DUF1202 family)
VKLSVILLTAIFLSVAAGVGLAADFSPFTGRVIEDDVNIRCDSTVGSPSIASMKKDAQLEVVEQIYDWYKVRLPKQAPAYIKKDLVECVSSKSEKEPLGGPDFPGPAEASGCLNARVSKSRVNIRLQPDETSPVLGKADEGTAIAVTLEVKDWYRIVPTPDTFGWIHKKFIEPVKPAPPEPPKAEKKSKVRKEPKKN